MLFLVPVAGLAITVAVANKPVERLRAAARVEFAQRNGGHVTETIDLSQEPGTIFSALKHVRLHGSVINGTINGLPLQQYRITYHTPGKKGTDTAEVLAITLPQPRPHLVIDSLVDSRNGESSFPVRFSPSQRLTLEGNFNRYFAVYAPVKHKLHAVDVLAPDVMQILMEHAAYCDVELVDNRLYFYWPLVVADKKDYVRMFTTAEIVLREVQHKLTRPTGQQESISATPAAASGARLKRGWSSNAISLVIISAAFLASLGLVLTPRFRYSMLPAIIMLLSFAPAAWIAMRSYGLDRRRAELEKRFGRHE